MLTRHRSPVEGATAGFLSQAGVELNRAERYRVFVSLSVLDMGPFKEHLGESFTETVTKLVAQVRSRIRACDYASLVGPDCLALLFPETSRQEAEIAAKRTAELVRQHLSEAVGHEIAEKVPVEIASYPDTAGAKALAEFLQELADKSRN
ncbi:diguanylate cyclase [candidate division GN15 bacterium]|nr:diguanylate cyclase [candidate division GN15 bacterium]